ncbi:MAG: phosphopantothenoylcysteine decarboxylase, partial [Rhodospirillales bacterium]
TGPVALKDPVGVATVHVETARDMLAACAEALPADIAVCAAAVADWRTADQAAEKMKKDGKSLPALALAENPDILATLSAPGKNRPALVVGFAAETENVVGHAQAKLARKGCDWICANDVSPETGTFGGDMNRVHLVTGAGVEDWPALSKTQVGEKLARRIADHVAAAATTDTTAE